jgi:AcrR family transcriptional regulator
MSSQGPLAKVNEQGELIDQTGRVLGPRAQTTRQNLLDSTTALLEERSLRDLRVADIARKVGTSPATFYQYFKDVEDAVLCLAEQATSAMPAIVEMIKGPWSGEAGLHRARRIAQAFIEHWDAHRAALRIRNMASDEGDQRFREVRNKAMTPVLTNLAEQIEANRKGSLAEGESPVATAAAMGAILERLSAYHSELENIGVGREELVETIARIVHRTVSGES